MSGAQCQRSGSCLHTDSSLPLPLWPQDKFQLKMPRRSSSPGSLPCLPWALWCPVIDIEDIPPCLTLCFSPVEEPSKRGGQGPSIPHTTMGQDLEWDRGCW